MRNLLVLLPMAWSVRNLVHSGALERLAGLGARIHLLIREPLQDPQPPWAAGVHPLLVPPERRVTGRAFLESLLKTAFDRQVRNGSHAVYHRWFTRGQKLSLCVRSRAIEALGACAQPRPFVRALESGCERLYRRSRDLSEVRAQIESLQPDMIWSTVCVSPLERPYLLAAHDLGIRSICSILSFDNLTSRGPMPPFDYYTVWNGRMRDQLLRFYPRIAPKRVAVTGTPQFDFHRRPEFRQPRSGILDRLGLPENARYFLYAASSRLLAPAEPELVRRLLDRLERDPMLGGHWLVVRLHPLDSPERWAGVRSTRLALSPADPADQELLVGSLAHSDGCLNVASTMSLDAAILDRPVICLRFDREPDSPQEILFDEYEAEHYRPLVASGGLRMAADWDQLLALMREAVTMPARDRTRRAAMVENECGVVDGMAAERVATAVVRWLECPAQTIRSSTSVTSIRA